MHFDVPPLQSFLWVSFDTLSTGGYRDCEIERRQRRETESLDRKLVGLSVFVHGYWLVKLSM